MTKILTIVIITFPEFMFRNCAYKTFDTYQSLFIDIISLKIF